MTTWTAASPSGHRAGTGDTTDQAWRHAAGAALELAPTLRPTESITLTVGEQQVALYPAYDSDERYNPADTHAGVERVLEEFLTVG